MFSRVIPGEENHRNAKRCQPPSVMRSGFGNRDAKILSKPRLLDDTRLHPWQDSRFHSGCGNSRHCGGRMPLHRIRCKHGAGISDCRRPKAGGMVVFPIVPVGSSSSPCVPCRSWHRGIGLEIQPKCGLLMSESQIQQREQLLVRLGRGCVCYGLAHGNSCRSCKGRVVARGRPQANRLEHLRRCLWRCCQILGGLSFRIHDVTTLLAFGFSDIQ